MEEEMNIRKLERAIAVINRAIEIRMIQPSGQDTADELGISRQYVNRQVEEGEIPGYKIGDRVYVLMWGGK